MWNTNRPRRLYFTIFFNLLFPYFPIFSLNCVCCHLFSADNFCFHVQFYPFRCTEFVLNHIYSTQFPAKNLKIVSKWKSNRPHILNRIKKNILIWINIFGLKINVYFYFYDEHVFFDRSKKLINDSFMI
jgi:hypothetical protein